VPDSKEGLSSIRSGKHDLILLDMAMPVFSGLDILRSLKTEDVLKRTNVVVFTASSDPKMYEEIRNSGVKEILKKPCGVEDLKM
jgi:two-component system OmpR family response regulator